MRHLVFSCALLLAATTQAAEKGPSLTVPMNMVDEKGVVTPAGEITVTESQYGLIFWPSLSGLPTGLHGFHIHEHPSCDAGMKDGKPVPAMAAGGHWDPMKTERHAGPYSDGHLGDLPALYVGNDARAVYPVLAPRLKSLDALHGHALMIHAGGDNHDDHPAPLGGGGARIACGVIK
ncbi:MAG TPA: superoxide dismutase [Cu-Zn] SodC [Burkholderiaceae bacterium]